MLKNKVFSVAAAMVLLGGFAAVTNAQDPAKGKEMSVTGCLNKGSSQGNYEFTDLKTGQKMDASGSADLEKHVNHTVTLTGSENTQGGKTMLNVTKVQHVATTCQAPTEKGVPTSK